jgi:hypothetical protein
VFERYPMMRSTAFERRMLFDRPGFAQVPAGFMVASNEVTSIVPQN